ncbi:MAG: hypothetical protein ACOC4M_02560 [Promethearchaeia archaeon]
MIKFEIREDRRKKEFMVFLFFSFLLLTMILIQKSFFTGINSSFSQNKTESEGSKFLKPSAIGAKLNLTNANQINNSRFSHYESIPIEGHFRNESSEDPLVNYNVSLYVDGTNYPQFNDTTDSSGNFRIIYNISDSLNIYTSHEIKAKVIDFTNGSVLNPDYYTIFLNTTSEFDILEWQNSDVPYLTGEYFDIDGYLRYENNSGIAQKYPRFGWYNNGTHIGSGFTSTNENGEIAPVQIPETTFQRASLKLNYSDYPFVNYSEWSLPESESLKLFSDITCQWDVEPATTEGEELLIEGTVVSSINNSFLIHNRQIEILYNGNPVDQLDTDGDGSFSYTHTIPEGAGTNNLQIRLINSAGKDILSNIFSIDVTAAAGEDEPVPTPTDDTPPPLMNFFLYFIPIVAGIIVVLIILGYRYLQQQEEESRVVELPLGDKLTNLKLLKDSGRLEEALSYLFNAIYMDLINAKFGRSKKASETIRDMAIVSVKELKLPPEKIYPFITKIEEYIYARPHKITEKDFNKALGLFSPIYFELTNQRFNIKI